MRLGRRASQLFNLTALSDFVGVSDSPFRGVYPSFEQARLAVPKGKRLGYDHPEAAALHHGFIDRLRLSDYPVLFWMMPSIREAAFVFDLGGHVGLSYYAFERYLTYPANLRWVVCDLPEVTKVGKEIALERNASKLSFTVNFHEAEGADILLTAGALQYIESPLSLMLSQLQQRPEHLLINRLPLWDGNPFVTLQNLGVVINPYQIFNRKSFIQSIVALGYELIDNWEISEPLCGSCVIPFHAGKSVRPYSGLHFRLRHG